MFVCLLFFVVVVGLIFRRLCNDRGWWCSLNRAAFAIDAAHYGVMIGEGLLWRRQSTKSGFYFGKPRDVKVHLVRVVLQEAGIQMSRWIILNSDIKQHHCIMVLRF